MSRAPVNEGLRSEALRAALTAALGGKFDALEDLLRASWRITEQKADGRVRDKGQGTGDRGQGIGRKGKRQRAKGEGQKAKGKRQKAKGKG